MCPSVPNTMKNIWDTGWGTQDSYWNAWSSMPCSYLYSNAVRGKAMAQLNAPADTVMLTDGIWCDGDGIGGNLPRIQKAARHMDGLNVAYADGHVKWANNTVIPNLRWTP